MAITPTFWRIFCNLNLLSLSLRPASNRHSTTLTALRWYLYDFATLLCAVISKSHSGISFDVYEKQLAHYSRDKRRFINNSRALECFPHTRGKRNCVTHNLSFRYLWPLDRHVRSTFSKNNQPSHGCLVTYIHCVHCASALCTRWTPDNDFAVLYSCELIWHLFPSSATHVIERMQSREIFVFAKGYKPAQCANLFCRLDWLLIKSRRSSKKLYIIGYRDGEITTVFCWCNRS